jgi:uncharacterized protein YukE
MKIRVDPQDLINEAAKTRTRIADREKYLERMNCLVEELRNHWEGSDYDAYKNNWDQAMSQNSKSPLHVVNRNQEMIAAFLMDAARRYEDLNDRMQKHVIIWNQNSYETSEFYKTKGTEFFIDSDKMRGYRMLIRMRLQTQFDQDEDTKKGIASLETAAQDAEDTEKTISALIKKI